MILLTPSGEVGTFVDDDQFGSGQSQDKCGPEAVSVFWHATAPGQTNPYTSADVHQMAAADYVRFIGPDTSSDTNGTSNQTLYDMLAFHHFAYYAGPMDFNWIKAWLQAGYPVILGIYESSVEDLALGSNPYNWDTGGLTHIVVATGPGNPGEVLIRDTANIGSSGVRAGPRRYDTNKLHLTSATMVVPSWMTNPGSSTPPAPAPAVNEHMLQQARNAWNATTASPAGGNNLGGGIFAEGKTPPYSTGIALAWQDQFINQLKNYGPPGTYEYNDVDWSGNSIVVQWFALGRCEWDGSPHWFGSPT